MNALFFLCFALPTLALADKVNVTVYYESLCPDSQRFFNNQLYPTFKTPLVTFMNLVLVPYGNANTTGTEITCQHGPAECYGNRIQACTISKVQGQDKQLDFINCLMKAAYDSKPKNESAYADVIKMCANWTSSMIQDIETCANSTESDNLMSIYEKMTKSAQPPIKGVPTIFFNDQSSKDINEKAATDFLTTLCGYISNKPHECNAKGSGTDLVASVALVLSALVLSRFH